MGIEPLRLRKTLAFLLRHRPDVGHLELDGQGWCRVDRVTRAVTRLTRSPLSTTELVEVARTDPRRGFEVRDGRIRARPRARRPRRQHVPDILYLPCEQADLDAGRLPEQRSAEGLRLFDREHKAWLVAHRRGCANPQVCYVDAGRARRAGANFKKRPGGVFLVERLPLRFVLNLRRGFGIQASAGGFLVRQNERGTMEVGLVRVRRRSGLTWEVAKGKMEQGETPRQTAMREIIEEMGLDVQLEVLRELGVSHYGFTTPSGEPRLKILYLFILRPKAAVRSFTPARPEGIEEVAFFDADAAVRVVSHGSLREPVRRLRRWMHERDARRLRREKRAQARKPQRPVKPVGAPASETPHSEE